jgi:hypothetical protein
MHHIALGYIAGAFGRWRDAVAQEVRVEQYAATSSKERGVAVLLRHLKHCRRRRIKMKQVYIHPAVVITYSAHASSHSPSTPTHHTPRSF